MPQDFVKIARIGELSPGDKKVVHLGNEPVLLVNVEGSYYAVGAECPHAYVILGYGQLYGDEVVCPLHGSAFNLKTGAVLSPPAADDLTVYPVKIEGDDILIGPPQA